jgi:hypothetical protein
VNIKTKRSGDRQMKMTKSEGPHLGQGPMRFIPAPYFCLARGLFIPYAIAWDPVSGLFQRLEGPDGFTTWDKAEEASRFLAHSIE